MSAQEYSISVLSIANVSLSETDKHHVMLTMNPVILEKMRLAGYTWGQKLHWDIARESKLKVYRGLTLGYWLKLHLHKIYLMIFVTVCFGIN